MSRDCQGKPDHMTPSNFRKLRPKTILGFRTGIDPSRILPYWNVSFPNSNIKQSALNLHKEIRPSGRPNPAPINKNRGNTGIQITTSVIHNTVAISVQQSPSRMPTIKPKKDGMTLSHFETDELLNQLTKIEQFFPAPRTHFGDSCIPQATPLQL
jgi:hypothetical protein